MHIVEIETYGRGGLAHYAFNLARALAERGHRVSLLTAAGYELESRSDLPDSVRVVEMLGRAGRRLEASLPRPVLALLRRLEAVVDAFALAAFVRQLRPDVVHLHCTNPAALLHLGLLARLDLPLVFTAHVVTPHEPIPLQTAIYRRIHRLGDLVIAHSDFDRRRLLRELGVDPDRVLVVPHGEYGFFGRGDDRIDRESARRELGLGDRDEVALFFGYIREYKGLDVLLDAWPAVVAARPAARLVVAGEPIRLSAERRAELEQRASRLGAVHHFKYIPFAEVARYFAAGDVLVMPYRHISQSGVLYLALSFGLPVVATRVGALVETLRDGDSGLLVPPEAPDELARALGRVLGDGDLRQRLAHGGLRLARAHSWPAIAETTERAFEALIASQRSST